LSVNYRLVFFYSNHNTDTIVTYVTSLAKLSNRYSTVDEIVSDSVEESVTWASHLNRPSVSHFRQQRKI